LKVGEEVVTSVPIYPAMITGDRQVVYDDGIVWLSPDGETLGQQRVFLNHLLVKHQNQSGHDSSPKAPFIKGQGLM
jgi:hypothetical protein